MKAYFDTNVLVAASRTGHIHHTAAFAVLDVVTTGNCEGCTSAHALAEFYSVMSRSPFKPPPSPEAVLRSIRASLLMALEIIDVTVARHLEAIETCVRGGWRGGRVHDAVHVQAALQAGCDVIYTYNVRDFETVRGGFAGRIETP